MKAAKLPSLKYLNECFKLSSKSPSGILWRVRPLEHFPTPNGCKMANANCAGKRAGNQWTDSRDTNSKYWCVMILGITYLAHRIIYSLHHNIELESDVEIDHIDLNGLNNRKQNLRLATGSHNSYNKRIQKSNTSGYKGVNWHSGWKAWIGRVTHNGIRYRTEPCPTPEMAFAIISKWREDFHKEFTNHG